MKIFTLLLLLSTVSEAAPIACPELFLTEFSSQAKLEAAVKANPALVNCVDEVGQTPLSFALNVRLNYCPLTKAAQFLIEQGAKVNATPGSGRQGPLFYAVQAYGSIFGNPELEYEKNDACLGEVNEVEMRGIVKTLLAKGADAREDSRFTDDVPSIAREMKVEYLLGP